MIYGERIRLRAVEREDLPAFVTWINDPEVRAGLSLYTPISQVAEEGWFENVIKQHPAEQVMVIEAKQGKKWKLIGNCGLIKVNWRLSSAEIGIMIGERKEWNKGYGTEALRLILRHGFETLNLHRLFLRVYEDNPGAIRAYEKAGFVHEGRMREAQFSDGEYKDVLLMSVLRSEWNATK